MVKRKTDAERLADMQAKMEAVKQKHDEMAASIEKRKLAKEQKELIKAERAKARKDSISRKERSSRLNIGGVSLLTLVGKWTLQDCDKFKSQAENALTGVNLERFKKAWPWYLKESGKLESGD